MQSGGIYNDLKLQKILNTENFIECYSYTLIINIFDTKTKGVQHNWHVNDTRGGLSCSRNGIYSSLK